MKKKTVAKPNYEWIFSIGVNSADGTTVLCIYTTNPPDASRAFFIKSPNAECIAMGKMVVIAVNMHGKLVAALEEADRLYTTHGLTASDYACGKWINQTRDILRLAKEAAQ